MKILRRMIISLLPVVVLIVGFLSCKGGKSGSSVTEPAVIVSSGTIGLGGSLSDSLGMPRSRRSNPRKWNGR